MKLVFNTGGTRTKVGISPDGVSLSEVKIFPTNADPDLWLDDLKQVALELAKGKKISAMAGGVAGVLDEGKAKLLRSPHLQDWQGWPIKTKLEKEFGAKMMLENDVVMEGIGEAMVGAGRRKRVVGFMAVGTGIGGVKIEEGKVCQNVWGFEPGHQIIDVDEEIGYWEDFASGSAMKAAYGKAPEEIKDEQIWETETRFLALGVYNAIVFWSPEILILGGSVMLSIDMRMLVEILKQQMRIFPSLPEIVRGELGNKAGLYGALEVLKRL